MNIIGYLRQRKSELETQILDHLTGTVNPDLVFMKEYAHRLAEVREILRDVENET